MSTDAKLEERVPAVVNDGSLVYLTPDEALAAARRLHPGRGVVRVIRGVLTGDCDGIRLADGHLAYIEGWKDEALRLRAEVERLRKLALHEVSPFCDHFDVVDEHRVNCGAPHAFEVSWSTDRRVRCCAAHLADVKYSAAHDGPGDRADNPYVVDTHGAADLAEVMGTTPAHTGDTSR